jgi:glycosyltransferase involved in cell wall biosynthesis
MTQPRPSVEIAQDRGKIVFSLFGRIKPEKGQWLLVEALALLTQEELSSIEVNIVGGVVSGKEHLVGELSDKIERAGLKGVVSVLPFTQDISALLRMSDVCLVPSVMEDPFPTTVLEAMAAGKPVIATTVGGIPEMITDGTNGLLCSANSPEELASCVRLVLNRPDMVRTLGANARSRFEEGFTLEQFSRRFRVAVLGGCDGATKATP